MSPGEAFRDLTDRLENAARTLQTMAEEKPLRDERVRLQGKVEGVRLALDYVRQYTVQPIRFDGGDA